MLQKLKELQEQGKSLDEIIQELEKVERLKKLKDSLREIMNTMYNIGVDIVEENIEEIAQIESYDELVEYLTKKSWEKYNNNNKT